VRGRAPVSRLPIDFIGNNGKIGEKTERKERNYVKILEDQKQTQFVAEFHGLECGSL
jgi:hypothetical protein